MKMVPGEKIDMENLENLVAHHMAFLIRTVSDFTGRYVSVENDEEFSIALEAFAEAVERYDSQKGAFLSFARLVIISRLKNHAAKYSKERQNVSLEVFLEEGGEIPDTGKEEREWDGLHEEILRYREELLLFGLTLEKLADNAPKHRDTRRTAVDAAEKAGRDDHTVELTYRKKRLPVREVARLAQVTEKIVKRSKIFILATMIIFVKRFTGLIYWIRGTRCTHVS